MKCLGNLLCVCIIQFSEELVSVGDDTACRAPFIADKDIWELIQSSNDISHADSDDEKELNIVAPVLTSSEMRSIMKSTRICLDAHSNAKVNDKMEGMEQLDAKKVNSKKYQIIFPKF
ncbi:hypothetical protein TNCV_4773081 [Trichonephila clavipes]|nr:hypothetical protein TNCV_4773081 [Trichonephila clavipes]